MRSRALVIVVLLVSGLASLPSAAAAGSVPSVVRYAGGDRYATAAAVAAGDFPEGGAVNTVFVTAGTSFPDALAGAAVAGRSGAPLLLVAPAGIPAPTASELSRLDPDTIVVLGGETVVSPAVEGALGRYAAEVVRLAGADRYATAVEISRYGFPAAGSADQVVITSGTDFADAMAGGPLAASIGAPVLLTDPGFLPEVVATEITRLAPERIVVLGGEAAVSAAVFSRLRELQPAAVRIAGTDRYDTGIAISTAGFSRAQRVYVATGLDYPDALAGAAAAASRGVPVLLVPASQLHDAAAAEILRLGASEIVVLGGRTAVTTAVLKACAALIGATTDEIEEPAPLRTRPRSGMVALTFDDGPHPTYTPIVLDILDAYGVKATFFVIGRSAELYPQIVEEMVRRGHSVQNHTYDHAWLTRYSNWGVEKQLADGSAAITAITNSEPRCFRPPFGAISSRVRGVATGLGLEAIMWDVDPFDWKTPGSITVARHVVRYSGDGDIILLHDPSGRSTYNALGDIITGLRARGLEFDTLCE